MNESHASMCQDALAKEPYQTRTLWQSFAVCCSALQCVAVHRSALECVAVCYNELQCVVVRCSALQCAAVRCSALQYNNGWAHRVHGPFEKLYIRRIL